MTTTPAFTETEPTERKKVSGSIFMSTPGSVPESAEGHFHRTAHATRKRRRRIAAEAWYRAGSYPAAPHRADGRKKPSPDWAAQKYPLCCCRSIRSALAAEVADRKNRRRCARAGVESSIFSHRGEYGKFIITCQAQVGQGCGIARRAAPCRPGSWVCSSLPQVGSLHASSPGYRDGEPSERISPGGHKGATDRNILQR